MLGAGWKCCPPAVHEKHYHQSSPAIAARSRRHIRNRVQAAALGAPVETIALTAHVARAVYEGESNDLGLLRTVSGFSPAFRKIDEALERTRYRMQKECLRRLFDASRARKGIGFDEARPILWMYTSREIYRMLVIEGGWTPDRYQE